MSVNIYLSGWLCSFPSGISRSLINTRCPFFLCNPLLSLSLSRFHDTSLSKDEAEKNKRHATGGVSGSLTDKHRFTDPEETLLTSFSSLTLD